MKENYKIISPGKNYADDRIAMKEEFQKLLEYPDRRIKFIVDLFA